MTKPAPAPYYDKLVDWMSNPGYFYKPANRAAVSDSSSDQS